MHIIFLVSVFDIYFKSPIVHGITPQSSPLEAPARRLVLIVADGLRADSFFQKDDLYGRNAPHLRSVIGERGAWGVSHTRVPTESRPGHVALIAGLYEDPSAVAKGWKENPVEFDSVFNESRHTWSWGSPDILPMFAKGASGDHVYIDTYGPEVEDFSGSRSTTGLDSWVFNKVEGFLEYAKTNGTLNEKLHQDKIIFFLHLLGLDTAGHTHKPYSVEYKENIRVVDTGVKKVEEMVEEFYQHDKKTAYVFTADHGMTDWGSHGAGDKSETETPLVAWGAGVRGPRPSTDSNPSSPVSWGLGHLTRSDVNQADIAPLMASLIGVPVPVNSVGTLPHDYLDVTERKLSELMFCNARQMVAQYNKKRELTEAGALPWIYREFSMLSKSKETEIMAQIHSHIAAERYRESIAASEELISLSLLGLDYYQNYYQHLLLSCITVAFLGWIAWLLHSLVDENNHRKNSSLLDVHRDGALQDRHRLAIRHSRIYTGGYWVNLAFLLLVILTVALLFLQMLPPQFYIYCLLPEFVWWAVARHWNSLMTAISRVRSSLGLQKLLMLFMFHVIGIEILVVSFFYRFFLSVGMLGLAAWPIAFPLAQPVRFPLLAGWLSSCLFLAVFPLLPVVGRQPNTQLVALSGWLFLLLAAYCASRLETCVVGRKDRFQSRCVVVVQLIMIPTAIWNLVATAQSIKDKQGLLLINQIVSWSMLGVSLFLPLLSSQQVMSRLYSVVLSLFVPFLLLSASHEGLFILALILNMFCWLVLELHSADSAKSKLFDFTFRPLPYKGFERPLSSKDFRRAYFFLFYIIVSFFGTGNVASINSFDPTWVRCFLTVFSPFVMTLLILWKIMIPFLAVTCTFRALNTIVQAPTGKLFFIVLIFSDAMGLHFLHLVTNRGSWLDIGTSISHYVIVQTTVLFLVLLYGLARVLTSFSLWSVQEAFGCCHLLRNKREESCVSLELGDKNVGELVDEIDVTNYKRHSD